MMQIQHWQDGGPPYSAISTRRGAGRIIFLYGESILIEHQVVVFQDFVDGRSSILAVDDDAVVVLLHGRVCVPVGQSSAGHEVLRVLPHGGGTGLEVQHLYWYQDVDHEGIKRVVNLE